MKYEEKLARELKNPDAYLRWKDSIPISELNGLAYDLSVSNQSIESQITRLFIYHQIIGEQLIVLNKYCELVTKASIYPLKFTTESYKYSDDFYVNLHKLKGTIEFHGKSKIISLATEVNNLRNDFAHKLVSNFYNHINEPLKDISIKFDQFYKLWFEAQKWFYEQLNRLRLKDEIISLVNKYS